MVDVEIVEGVVEGDDLSPGEAEYDVDPLALQRFEDDSGCFHGALRWSHSGAMRAARPALRDANVAGKDGRRPWGQERPSPPPRTAPVSAPGTKAT